MCYRIKIVAFIIITFTCCTNKISTQEKFVKKNRYTNFSIFKNWEIEPRDRSQSTAFLMKYITPFSSDTNNDKISLLVYAQIYSSDSNIYNTSITDINKYRFCKKHCISFEDFNKYIDSVFSQFMKLNINSISGGKGVYIINIDENKKLLKYDTAQSDSVLIRLNTLGYEKIMPEWYYKIQ